MRPLVLSALEEDSQMSRLLACRCLCAILRLTGTSLHHEALNKIYPGKSQCALSFFVNAVQARFKSFLFISHQNCCLKAF